MRTNRIHVITRPINMPFIRKLIAEFDANVEFAKPVTRASPLYFGERRFAGSRAGLNRTGGRSNRAALGGGWTATQQQQPQHTPQSRPTLQIRIMIGHSSTGGGSNLNISEELSTQPVDTTPKAVTVGNAKIIADQRANTIIVLGNREVVVKVAKILDEMDVKAPQVALSTVIGELTLNNDEEFGVDYFVRVQQKVRAFDELYRCPSDSPEATSSPAASPGGSPTLTGRKYS